MEKRVSAKLFFTVVWRIVCQVLAWFFGLFGYKRDGKFAKCVWGLFATSAAVVMGIIAIIFVYAVGDELCSWYKRQHYSCTNPDCYENISLSRDIYFHSRDGGKGYIYNIRTGEKHVKHVVWIATPRGKDSLVCYSDGTKRGYFNMHTGRPVVAPRYDRAWIYSEGLAAVESDGKILFLDAAGRVAIDKGFMYSPMSDGYVFHAGHCAVTDAEGRYGLIDRRGEMVVPAEYDEILYYEEQALWSLRRGKESGVLSDSLATVLPMAEWATYVNGKSIDAVMPDHTVRKYDLKGRLVEDFCIYDVRSLEYETDEIRYRVGKECLITEGEEEEAGDAWETYRPEQIARLRAYVAGEGYEGLMTPDGRLVTMPLYSYIVAIGPDLYRCHVGNGLYVVLNGKGERCLTPAE